MFKFMLAILGAVAEIKRELTVEPIREGMAKAKRYGTRSDKPVGWQPRKVPASFEKYYRMWNDGDIMATNFARLISCQQADSINVY